MIVCLDKQRHDCSICFNWPHAHASERNTHEMAMLGLGALGSEQTLTDLCLLLMDDGDVAYLLVSDHSEEDALDCPRPSLLVDDCSNHRFRDGRTSGEILAANPRKCGISGAVQSRCRPVRRTHYRITVRLFLAAQFARAASFFRGTQTVRDDVQLSNFVG